ncbi:hypothetical protein H8356DRAFT_1720364 [Neocallimastix lanati (nom. inval.)]|uniref:FAR-17a/AIG1-like protein n=1 Tax=Neocallimastix californiae TaxID=1754190 RepID=A0A1Y2AR04_9FUNG|nr:hypothetical protein H8356DRAFT_1720364 [Neocallimastix sp. JGI-2020a]ORY24916.1 hypothetical protein LY90DRAFT_675022 [Neocallimastix californiae]|eukprot:ORY24916.1 hypothetical protein LY90DRAFT_675022 [Neocallimastix californiae]
MKNSNRMNEKISIILNITIVVFEIIALILSFKEGGFYYFIYYTILSNVSAMIVSSIYSVYHVKARNIESPSWLRMLRYVVTSCLTLTFFIVITVLVPLGIKKNIVDVLLIRGAQLYHHLLCPIISFVSFCIFEEGELSKKSLYISVIPTIIYSIVLIFLNIIKVITGPYPFLRVYEQPVFVTIIGFVTNFTIAYGLSWLIYYFSQLKINKKNKNNDKKSL